MKETGQLLPKKERSQRRFLSVQSGAVWKSLGMSAAALLLAGLQLDGQALPIAACLVGALPMGLTSAAAGVGACMGYIIAHGAAETAEFLALSVLLLAAQAVFQGTPMTADRRFLPCLTAAVCAVLGAVRLLGGGAWELWLVQTLCAGVCSAVFQMALDGNTKALLVPVVLAIAGASTVLPLSELSLLGAIALSAWTMRLIPAAAAAVALELFGRGEPLLAAILLPTLACQSPYIRSNRSLSALAFAVLPCLALLFGGELTAGTCFAVFGGTLLGSLLRLRGVQQGNLSEETRQGKQAALQNAAEILEILRDQLPIQELPPSVSEAESVYDGAAERICRCCERFHRCWQHRAKETHAALTGAARQIIENGMATAADFSPEFQENCCHLEGFVTAINAELEGMLYRRRYRMECNENRQLMAEEFACLAEYLRAEHDRLSHQARIVTAYRAEVAACRVGRHGSAVCGDRGVGFSGRNGDYFVLLCDGMGTGAAAAEYSAQTVRFLERLLKSGLEPESALKILNGAEILRGAGRYTTIDLLRLDLSSGEGTLFKWGSAPSYWRDGETVKKIGTSAPPPGVGVGGGNTPERYQMSLARGEMLILASDGVGETQTEAAICAYHGDSARELAALLVSGLPAEDDVSAVVVSLRPGAVHPS